MLKTTFHRSIFAQAAALSLVLATANCSGKTYSTLFQPFDLVFGARANSSVSVSLLAATPLTNTRVMLTFSKPVSLATAQLVANYRITDASGNSHQILAVSRDPNNSSIVFVDTIPQTGGNTYTVRASNIMGVDGSSLGSSNSATFTAPTNADQTGPGFGSVTAVNATTVEVFFNEAVSQTNPATGTAYSNVAFGAFFDLYTDSTCSTVFGDVSSAARDTSNYAKVTLTSSAMTSGTTYYVCATTSVRDIWGNANSATVASGSFVYSAPTPRVSSAVSSSSTSVLVTFDQAMTTTGGFTTPGNYTFTGCGALSATGATVTAVGTTQALLTGLTTGTAGTCTLTVNTAITSALGGALTAATNKALFSYTNSAATDTVAPTVVGVTTTNSTTIEVTFSENVTGASIADFNLSPALDITNVSCTGNVCTLTTAEQSTTPYSLSITNNAGGIQDTATPANTLSTGSTSFTGDGKPYIVAIYPVDSSTVMVEWSEAIGNAASVGTGDYTITGATITAAALDPAGTDPSKFVRLTIDPVMTSGTGYTLSVNNPTGSVDSTGNGTLGTVPNGGTFTGPTSTQAPQVTGGSSPSPTTLIVNFNEPLNNATIANGDFALSSACAGLTINSATQIQAGVVQLVLAAGAAADGNCTVTVGAGNVSDLAGNTIAATNNTATFAYTGTATTDGTAPTIGSIVAISNTEVRVYFSETVRNTGDANSGNTAANYSFSPSLTGGVQSVTCTGTYCTLTLNAPGTSAQQYTVTVSNVQDVATPTPNTMTTASATFSGIGSSVTAPTLYQAVLINSTTVELSFTESMGLTSVECTSTGTCATKYTVTGGNSVSAAVRQADTTKVRLTLSPGAYGSSNSYTVTATGLTDAAGNTIGTPNSATFSGSATAPATTNLGDSSDLGVSNSDNATNPCVFSTVSPCAAVAPGLVFTGTTTANTTVYLFDDGVIVGVAVSDSSGNYSITLTSAGTTVTNGNNVFNVATVGPTGLVSDLSPGLTVNYDASAPGNPAAAADLVAGSDTGISSTDNITSDTTPTLSGSGLTAGDYVYIYDGATLIGAALVDGSGNWTWTLTSGDTTMAGAPADQITYAAAGTGLSAGAHTITYKVGDTAGNESAAASPVLNLTVDTAAPTLTLPVALTANSYIELPFAGGGIYGSSTAADPVLIGNLTVTLNSGTSGITISPTVRTTTNTALTGGETTIRVYLNVTGTPNGSETVQVVANTNAIFDVAGNALSFDTGVKNFSAAGVPNITGTPTFTSTGATTGYITVVWDEAPYTNTGAAGVLTGTDFDITFTKNAGGNANSMSITGLQDGTGGTLDVTETTMRVLVSFDLATSGAETFRINAKSGEIFSGIGPFNTAPTTEQAGPFTATDTLAPSAPGTADMTAATDSGSLSSDNYTSNQTPQFIIACETGATVQLYTDNPVAATATGSTGTCAAGTVTLTAGTLAAGAHNISARQTDAASNQSVASTGLAVTIDTGNPAVTGTPDLQVASDTGSSSTDNLTNDTTPTFDIACETNASVQLYSDAVATGSAATCAAGTVTLTSGSLGAGSRTITAVQTDPAGNASVASAGLSVTIDTTADAATGTADLQAASDTGSSNSDNITNDTTPTFDISCVTGSTVQLYSDAVATGTPAVCAGSTVTLTAGALSAGSRSITAVQTDPAGNASPASGALAITLDTTADAATGTPDLQAASDTGSSNSDNITNDTTPTFDISCVTGSTVQLYSDAVATGSSAVCAGGTVTLTTAALTAGARSITAIQTDPAGNASVASSALSVTIDTGTPAVTGTPDLQATSDLGSSSTDNLTNDTTATFDLTCETGTSVQLYADAVATGAAGTCTAGTVTLTSAALSEGARSITAIQTDTSGNASAASGALSVTIDTTAPAATGTPDLQAASDTGSSTSDNTTNDTTPTFDLTCVTGTSVQLYVDSVASGSAGTCAAGTVTLTTAALAAGTRSITAVQTDPAGNASPASGNLSITIDTTADAAPGAPDLQAASDLGSSNTDNITNDTTPTFDISCVTGSSVQLYSDAVASGTAATCAGSTVTLTTGALAAGARSITAVQTDPAGNASVASSALSVTIDTGVPTAPAALNLADADDTGTSNSDNITRNTTALTIDGTSEANATIRIYLTSSAGTLLQTVTANGSGVWSGDITLSEGVNSVVATATDAGGNTSTDSTGLSITVDATADAAPGTPDMTAGTDSGSSNSDNLTSNQTPSFTVSCVNGSSVQLYDNTTSTGTAVTCAGGSATVTAGTLSAGTHSTMNAKQTDAAGNESAASGNLSITIDITGPTVSSVTSSTGDGTYGLSQVIAVQVVFNESVTVSGNPQLTLETGATDAVVNYSSGSPGTTLTFNYTVAAGHSSGDLDYVANSSLQFNGGTIVDAAGNSATLTLPDPGQPNSLGASKAIVISTPNGPQIQTAEYYDTDGNGKIDHVKLTFDKNIDDATMDGYNSSGTPTNQLHNVTTVWSVAGYSNVRLDTRDVINNVNPADNGTNDTAIWLAFDEVGGATYDTGAKPNLLATDSSLKSTVGAGGCFVQTDSANCSTQTSADILTASVVEADKAPAIIIGATGVTTSQYLTITFSEPVDASNDGSCSGTLSQLDIQYTDTSAAGVDALDSNAANWTNTNACDDNAVAARLMDGGAGANLDAGSINSDTVNPASGRVYDIAGNVSLTTPTRVVTGAVAPYVVSVSATGARKIRITFSEAVVNAQATVLGNYTLIENPTETGCAGSGSDTVSLTGTVTAISSSIYELDTNADQCSTTTYRLTASSSITDVNESLGIATPAFGTFLGNERLKVSSATCLSTTSFKVVFNKAVRSGSGAGGAETTTRYKVTGPISLGAFSSATRGTSPSDNEVTIVHVVEQTGSAFTAIASNAVNGDGFDDVAAGTIQNSDLSESLQQSPRDRAGFSGCGTAIDNFNQGPITSNPFGDGTDAGNVVSYDSKIYVGTNNNGNSVARFNPDGSNPTLAQFEFTKDVTGGTHANTATTRDGGIAVPPYVTLGYSGCTSLNANQNGGCGPDNEDGRGTFAVGTLGASNYLFVGGSRSTANFDYIYYTADTDSTLNWSYIDLGTITGTATQGLQSMAVMNDRVYAGMAKNNSGGPNNLPDFGKVNFSSSSPGGDCVPGSTCDATDGTNGNRFRIDFMPYFGGASAGGTTTGMNYAFIVGVDSMIVFNNRLYAANGGYHQVDRNGTIIRSNNTNPIACSAVNTCADWTEIGPRSNAAWFNSPTNNRFSLQLTKIANIFPYDKAFAQFAIYNNRLFVTRTVCNIANGALVAAQTAAPAADPGCTDGTDTNRRAQLWKCDPASTGNATECDAADWSIVADDSTGVTNMGVAGNRSMTMVVANGSYLYIGYDNGGGIQIWRTNTANPGAASASWSQIGGNGLGDTTNMLNIYSATSVQQGADYYIYVSAGKSGQPLAVYRQKN